MPRCSPKREWGCDGVPNPGLIESAICRPYDGYHRSMVKKAAVLLHGVASNHGFADGNKRTALLLLDLLLERSGYMLVRTRPREDLGRGLEGLVKGLARKSVTQTDAEDWLQVRLRPSRRPRQDRR
jgi:death on curing protein